MDFATTHQLQETTDDSALLLSHKVNCIVSRSVSCPTLVLPEREDTSCEAQQAELSPTDQAEQEEVDYGELLAKHSECCNNPCGVDCPMYPELGVPIEAMFPKQDETTGTSNSTDCSCSYTAQHPTNTSYVSQQPDTPCAYYWDSATGQYYLLPALQPTQYSATDNSTASQYYSGQQASPEITPNPDYMYAYNFYALHYAELYQQYYASYYSSNFTSGCEEILSMDDADLPLPMSDRKRRRLLREMNKTAALCQRLWYYSFPNIQSENSCGANYHQASSFQPTVLQSDPQPDHSPAFPLINGQYETSFHSVPLNHHSSQDPHQYPIDIEAMELDALLWGVHNVI